ncbi:hypothetical protein Sjap_025681 [Stephania japonica]|uniref:Uncharacterized protein n=1 Tax=Stephania japonica TaxID=461633 RepID=A0AAP0E227_9MAGN
MAMKLGARKPPNPCFELAPPATRKAIDDYDMPLNLDLVLWNRKLRCRSARRVGARRLCLAISSEARSVLVDFLPLWRAINMGFKQKNQLRVLCALITFILLIVLLPFTNVATAVDLWKPENNAVYCSPPPPLRGPPRPITAKSLPNHLHCHRH